MPWSHHLLPESRGLTDDCVFPPRYLEILGQEQFAGPQEAEDVAEDVSISVNEVVLLQTVQHNGLGAVKQAADPATR